MKICKGPRPGPFAYLRLCCGSGGGNFAGVGIDDLIGLVLFRPGGAAAGGLLEPVAIAVHRQDADMVRDPVEQGAGEPLRPQNLRPVLERQVGGNDCRAALVALREDLEQQLCSGRRQRYLRQMLDKFGVVHLALAAYNAGPGAVERAGGIPRNGETPAYVREVLRHWRF